MVKNEKMSEKSPFFSPFFTVFEPELPNYSEFGQTMFSKIVANTIINNFVEQTNNIGALPNAVPTLQSDNFSLKLTKMTIFCSY